MILGCLGVEVDEEDERILKWREDCFLLCSRPFARQQNVSGHELRHMEGTKHRTSGPQQLKGALAVTKWKESHR